MGQMRSADTISETHEDPWGYDSFDVCLGDLMRGERATMGKSLQDVERELKIKAVYIDAIENADAAAFETPGFIPGYVRSYARYLDMDPDKAFTVFCAESGYVPPAASLPGRREGTGQGWKPVSRNADRGAETLFRAGTPFLPEEEGFLNRLEPAALGSTAVLLALIAVIGYGAWSVLNEVQKVRVTPTENAPAVLSDLDPVTARDGGGQDADQDLAANRGPETGTAGRFDRLYRPQALDVPVMTPRDAPIAALDPGKVGALPLHDLSIPAAPLRTVGTPDPAGQILAPVSVAATDGVAPGGITAPQVIEMARPGVRLVAVRPAWVRVKSADGTTLIEGIMNAGQTFDVPETEEPAILKVGESGAMYFEMAGQLYGPVGATGSVTSKIALSAQALQERFQLASAGGDADLSRYVAELAQTAAAQD